jgi:hypothetical protein
MIPGTKEEPSKAGWGIPNPWGAIKNGANAVKDAAGNMIPGSSDNKG